MKSIFKTLIVFAIASLTVNAAISGTTNETEPAITILNPPEREFFSKQLYFRGIPIKAHQVVSDEAMHEAYRRVSMLLTNLAVKQPMLISNLMKSGVELHLIGQHQVTSDLPEFRNLKGKALPEYDGLTIDQRTRGMGGRLSSCGEENLLKLKTDHYYGRDICAHEFSHAIRNDGMPLEVVARFNRQYQRSLDKGLWKGAYSASNADEFFSELTMWYFGTHGDLNMTGPKPENGPEGLKKYDPEAYAIFDDFYGGRISIGKMVPGGHEWTEGANTTNKPTLNPDSK
jgi:alpha-glucosidase